MSIFNLERAIAVTLIVGCVSCQKAGEGEPNRQAVTFTASSQVVAAPAKQYERCKGSYEPLACASLEERLEKESAADKASRQNRLEADRTKAYEAVANLETLDSSMPQLNLANFSTADQVAPAALLAFPDRYLRRKVQFKAKVNGQVRPVSPGVASLYIDDYAYLTPILSGRALFNWVNMNPDPGRIYELNLVGYVKPGTGTFVDFAVEDFWPVN